MRQAAFRAFASLGANDEDIRKRIIETENLMEQVVAGLQDPGGPKVRLAAVRCLHSLSRSVQQLRTTFQDHAVWRPLMQLLHGADKNGDGVFAFYLNYTIDEDGGSRNMSAPPPGSLYLFRLGLVCGVNDCQCFVCNHGVERKLVLFDIYK